MKMANFTYRFADEVVAVSKGVAESITKYTSIKLEDISVIYNPIIDDAFYLKVGEEVDDPVFEQPNVVIGAGAVVNKDIPDNSLAVGVPAKVIKEIENDL